MMSRRRKDLVGPIGCEGLERDLVEHTLENGLAVLALPRRQVHVVHCNLIYPVGSVDEPKGKTGIAHFLEHMLFKGSSKFPKGYLDRLILGCGGEINAETSTDLTRYWFALPSHCWESALEVEADRMAHATLDWEEVETERRVILEERSGELDQPSGLLEQAHQEATYRVHPYRNPILGRPEDLGKISLEDLRRFYRRHYRPHGAVLVLVGDLEPSKAIEAASRFFGPLSGRESRGKPSHPQPEPRQSKRREIRLESQDRALRGILSWHTVAMGHPDQPALEVFAEILGTGWQSRLWHELVLHRHLVTWIDACQQSGRWAGQLVIHVEAPSEADPMVIEEAIGQVLVQMAREGPTSTELNRAKRTLEIAWRWEQHDLASLASGLGEQAIYTSWQDYFLQHQLYQKIQGEQIQRLIKTYLDSSNLTVSWSVPQNRSQTLELSPKAKTAQPKTRPGATEMIEVPPELQSSRPSCPPRLRIRQDQIDRGWQLEVNSDRQDLDRDLKPGARREKRRGFSEDDRAQLVHLANGLRLVTEPRPGTGVLAIEFFVDAGVMTESRPGLGYLTGCGLEFGLQQGPDRELLRQLEDGGGSIEINGTGASLRLRSEDLTLGLELLACLVSRPRFPAGDWGWIRRRCIADLVSDRDDPDFLAEMAFRSLCYGRHPYGRDPRGSTSSLMRTTISEVSEHHRQWFRPDRSILAIVGDFDPGLVTRWLRRHFARWDPLGIQPVRSIPQLKDSAARWRRIHQPSEQVHVVFGHLGIRRTNPEYQALQVLDHLLSTGPGFQDRLNRIVRDELGLVYFIGGGITESADRDRGLFQIALGTRLAHLHEAISAIAEQIREVHAGRFSDAEFQAAQHYLQESWVFDHMTIGQRAERLLELVIWGLPLDEPRLAIDRLEQLTADRVRRVVRTYLKPSRMSGVQVGPVKRARRRRTA